MKYTKQSKSSNFILIIMVIISITFQTSCKKDQITTPIKASLSRIAYRIDKKNPYEINNIKNSLLALGRNENLDEVRIYYYYKFNPQKVSGDILSKFEQDKSIKIMDIPFADGRLYSEDNSSMTQDELESYKDGNLYIVFNSKSEVKTIFENGTNIEAEKLGELYLPKPEDQDLQLQALINAGYSSEPDIASLKIKLPCLFKQPCGKVTYLDQEDGQVKPVPRIKVWALVFGIPFTDHTTTNGDYCIPWLFSAGTFIGTHAENSRANVKPLNTTGTIVGAALSIISNFILGSQHTEGWFGSCAMKNNINIHFGNHTQGRYWAQILDAVQKHYDYTALDNIQHAPTIMTIYAQWSNNPGVNAASTMMLGHIQSNPISLFTNLSSLLFNTNLSVTAPNIFQLFTGLMPDMTVSVGSTQTATYSEELMQTMFHELGHASLFHQVGQAYWVTVTGQIISNIITFPSTSPNYPYGAGTENFAGLIQINEAWAEFIGKEHHRRFHTNATAQAFVWSLGVRQAYPNAIENDRWFSNPWINTGVFYDLLDPVNNEPNDGLGGFSIQNMFNCIGPNTNGFCDFRTKFLQTNSGVNSTTLSKLMQIQNQWNNNCYKNWPDPIKF